MPGKNWGGKCQTAVHVRIGVIHVGLWMPTPSAWAWNSPNCGTPAGGFASTAHRHPSASPGQHDSASLGQHDRLAANRDFVFFVRVCHWRMHCTEILNVLLSHLKCCHYGIAIVIDNCLVPLIMASLTLHYM